MGRRSRAGATGATVGAAAQSGTAAAGEVAQRAGAALQRGGSALEARSSTVGPAVADAVQDVLGAVGAAVEEVGGLLREPATRGGAALDALRGVPVGPPASVRRWPWAVAAALAGAAAGAGLAVLVARLQGVDAPGAQEPHELRAVVDRGDGVATSDPAPVVAEEPAPPAAGG